MVSADGREVLLDTAIGSKLQPFMAKKQNGDTYLDNHVFEKALTKAARNAKAKLLPEELKQVIMDKFVRSGQSKRIDPSTGEILDPRSQPQGTRPAATPSTPAPQTVPGEIKDWTGFWHAIASLGIGKVEVPKRLGGVQPEAWLKANPDRGFAGMLEEIKAGPKL